MIAVCGADLSAILNGNPLPLWQSVYVDIGDEIRFISPRSGLRAYLAVKDGFIVPTQLSSCSTVVREKLGGLQKNGEKITEEEILPYESSKKERSRQVPQDFIPHYLKKINALCASV